MSSIPLPALATRPPAEQPGPMDAYARALQIKGAQQQLQSGAMENQVRALQLHDQQAMTAAMQEWDGKDYNALPGLVLKNKGSAQAVLGLRASIVKQQQELANLNKDQLANEKTKNDYFAQQLENIKQLPPEQQGQAFEMAKADAVQRGHLDPQQAQGLQYQGPQQLDVLEKSLLGYSGALSAAEKQQTMANQRLEAQNKTAAEARAVEEFNAKKQKGLLGGQPSVPLMEMQDWLAKNPGKGPSDYEVAMKKIVPAFNFQMQNTGTVGEAGDVAKRFGMTPVAFDQAAEKYWTSGQLPPSGRGGPALALNKAIMNRAGELHPEGSLAANSAEYKANQQSLGNLQKQFDAVTAFEGTANRNIDRLKKVVQDIPDLGARFANVPARMISDKLIGTQAMARFKVDLQTVQNEAAKILNSSNATGVLSDSARHELQTIVDGNAPIPSIMASVEELQRDFANRHESYSEQIAQIKGRLRGGQSGGDSGSAPRPTHRFNPATGKIEPL